MMLSGYKTAIVAVLVTVVGALQGLDWASLLPTSPQAVGWVTAGIGAVMFVLRTITSTPIGGGSK